MKKIVLAFAFLPILSFAKENTIKEKTLHNLPPNYKIHKLPTSFNKLKKHNDPAFFVDGLRVDKSELLKIDTATIDKISVIKNDPNFKYGKIEVFLKKTKQ